MASNERTVRAHSDTWFLSSSLLNQQVWMQAIGRSVCQIGSGLLFFYLPLVFVNQVGLSATSVGFSLGLSSLAGVAGHFMGGVLVDSPRFGRKVTLSLSAVFGIAVSFLLAITSDLPLLILSSLLLGLSVGFYWTAADAAVIDVTSPGERHHAFALMSVAENVGVGVGVLGGGEVLMQVSQRPQLLFTSCGLIFLVFFLLVQLTIVETCEHHVEQTDTLKGIWLALKDRSLLVFVLANVLFTTYIALVTSTIPLYFTNFVPALGSTSGAWAMSAANLFTWCYIGIGAILQIPIAYAFSAFERVHVLMVAMLLWATGFVMIWMTGAVSTGQAFWGIGGLCIFAIASITYKPFAGAIVAKLAPESLRGAYVAVSSQCWALGYFVGPTIGGWTMDQSPAIAHTFWLLAALTTGLGLLILVVFSRMHSPSTVPSFIPKGRSLVSNS